MKRELEPYQMIERSIIKKYRKELWTPFIVAVKRYELIQAGDKIAVCISGGKDSMLMAKLMQELQKHSDVPFELVFLVMDPGYNERNRRKIEANARLLEIPITVFETDIFEIANASEKSPCYLCARMRRGICTARPGGAATSTAIIPTSTSASSAASKPSRWTPCRGINPKAWSTAFWNGFMRWKKWQLTLSCELLRKIMQHRWYHRQAVSLKKREWTGRFRSIPAFQLCETSWSQTLTASSRTLNRGFLFY